MLDYVVCSIAGTGVPGYYEGNRMTCKMNCPSGIAMGQGDCIYVSDRQNHCIRRLPGIEEQTAPGKEDDVSTFAGVPRKSGMEDGHNRRALFNEPGGICCLKVGSFPVACFHRLASGLLTRLQSGKILVVDRENHCIRAITDNHVIHAYGSRSSESGWMDAATSKALFNRPFGIAASST